MKSVTRKQLKALDRRRRRNYRRLRTIYTKRYVAAVDACDPFRNLDVAADIDETLKRMSSNE